MENEPTNEEEAAMLGCARMLAEAIAKPMKAMIALGAFPILVIAQTSDGNIAVLPTAPMGKKEIAHLLRAVVESLDGGHEIAIQDVDALARATCECPKCKAERNTAQARPIDPIPTIRP
jgi:hypothetical protein